MSQTRIMPNKLLNNSAKFLMVNNALEYIEIGAIRGDEEARDAQGRIGFDGFRHKVGLF